MSIILEQLTKRYDGHPVVNNVSLEVSDGEFFVLLGPTGAGKTTTLRIVAGLEKQDSGTISMDSAVGAQGKVYISIPAQGTGRVLVTVHNSLREYDAASVDQAAIETDTPIRVVWVDGNVLVVERI